MGNDAAVAVLSEQPRLLFDYFTQLFAQVTNPPLDAIREELVTSSRSKLGPEGNVLEPTAASCRQIILPYPVIDNDELAKLRYVNEHGETPGFKAFAIDGLFDVTGGGEALRGRHRGRAPSGSSIAIALGSNIIILSDRNSTASMAPIPSLLLTAAVHEHLVRERTRTRVGLVVETGDAREVHHIALLIGFGASAVNPYLAFETIDDMIGQRPARRASRPARPAPTTSRRRARASSRSCPRWACPRWPPTPGRRSSRRSGSAATSWTSTSRAPSAASAGWALDALAAEVAARHRLAHLDRPTERAHRELEGGGEYQWRREGEVHLFNPKTVFKLQHATRAKRYDIFKEYTRLVDDQSAHLATLRGLLRLREGVHPAAARRRGRAGGGDREALRHRGHVATGRSRPRRTRTSPSP